MKITVKKRGDDWMVEFNHGSQFFTLDYRVETKEEADWMKDRLSECFSRAFGEGWHESSGLHLADAVSGCPKCNSSNITRRQVNGVLVCNMCGHEWATEP